ncbi:MAG: hypothetical protein AB7T49_17585 [Oligoflexales bacterium]
MIFPFLLSWILAPVAIASDGPQNSGTLTLEAGPNNILDAHLQIDRQVIASAFNGKIEYSGKDISEFIRVSSAGKTCGVRDPIMLSNETVIAAAFVLSCPTSPSKVKVSFVDPQNLPDGFSLGVKGASGHFSLDKSSPEKEIITDWSYLYFLAGLSFFGGNDAGDLAGVGRQAALWFGGFHRLPPGIGLLLLVIAIWTLRIRPLFKIGLTGGMLAVAGTLSFAVLASKSVQTVFSFLYISHVYFGLLVALYISIFFAVNKTGKSLSLSLVLTATVFYGLETAVVIQMVEKLDSSLKSGIVAGFYLGNAIILGVVFNILYLIGVSFKKMGVINRLAPCQLIANGVGASVSLYLLVTLFLRLRI